MALSRRSLALVGVLVLVAFSLFGLRQAVAGPLSAPSGVQGAAAFAGQPVMQNRGIFLSDGTSSLQQGFPGVADRQILVIDFVSVSLTATPSEQLLVHLIVARQIGSDITEHITFALPTQELPFSSTLQKRVMVSQMVKIYVKSGDELFIVVERDGSAGTVGGSASISGYVVDES